MFALISIGNVITLIASKGKLLLKLRSDNRAGFSTEVLLRGMGALWPGGERILA